MYQLQRHLKPFRDRCAAAGKQKSKNPLKSSSSQGAGFFLAIRIDSLSQSLKAGGIRCRL